MATIQKPEEHLLSPTLLVPFSFSSWMEGGFIWSQRHGPGIATAVFDVLLGMQVVGVAALLATVDCTGCRHA